MDWGLKNRLTNIIQPDSGRTLMLAVDHGFFMGPTTGLEDLGKTVNPLLPYADTVMLTRGALRNWIPPETDTPIVLRVSGGTSILKDLDSEGITVSFEDALRLNVSGVAISIFVGEDNQEETLLNLSKLVDKAHKYGVPVLAVTAVGKDMDRDKRYLKLCCRIAAELGAHFIKTYYCDGFSEIIDTTPVPVVIAGGKKIPEKEALRKAKNALDEGAVGVDMGRNIFQSEAPVAMIRAVRSLIHEDFSVNEAHEKFQDLK